MPTMSYGKGRKKGGRPKKESYMTSRWTKMRKHDEQNRYWNSPARFKVVPAGRRSGKTELAKRRLVLRAMAPWDSDIIPRPVPRWVTEPRFFCGAPVWQQAVRIFWQDIKALVPHWALDKDVRGGGLKDGISESDKRIRLKSGSEIWVVGLDKPERIEGTPWDGCILDEYGNMKARTWPEHVRPALSDREGWCDFIGVPEGRNHYWDLAEMAQRAAEEALLKNEVPEWDFFHWKSADILPPKEIEGAKSDLDELTFRQEYEADFIYFQGRVYYPFNDRVHCRPLRYDPEQPLVFCFDFNISPGVAVICQEQQLPNVTEEVYDERKNETYHNPVIGTGIIGEVFIPRNSNTVAVCNKLIQDWEHHQGDIHIYGDATGGAGGSAQTEGSDWDIVRKMFKDKWRRIYYFIPSQNPRERARINAVNSRLMSTSGTIRMLIDGDKCTNVIKDLEGTRLLEGGAGDIDKKADPMLTHLSDALGYYIAYRFPVEELVGRSFELLW